MDKLSEEQKQELKTTFDSFDIDGNGSISADEMKIVLGKMGEPNDDKTVAELIDFFSKRYYFYKLLVLFFSN